MYAKELYYVYLMLNSCQFNDWVHDMIYFNEKSIEMFLRCSLILTHINYGNISTVSLNFPPNSFPYLYTFTSSIKLGFYF